MDNKPRITVTNQQKIKKLQKRIDDHRRKIAECEQEIELLSAPQPTLREIGAKIKEKGLSRNEVLKMLDKIEAR